MRLKVLNIAPGITDASLTNYDILETTKTAATASALGWNFPGVLLARSFLICPASVTLYKYKWQIFSAICKRPPEERPSR